MVRGFLKQDTGSGSYWNLSQGSTSTLHTSLAKYSPLISLEPLVSNEQRQVGKSLGDHLRARFSVACAE